MAVEPWLIPEKLRQHEKEARDIIDAGGTGGGHLGAYYAYRTGTNKGLIEPHGVIDDEYALGYARNIRALLKSMGQDAEGSVFLDAGCGIGVITNAFAALNAGGKTFGLDLSEDGIAIAREKYPACTFSVQSADELDNFEDDFFDVIHTREFYPFTRSNDDGFHLEFFRAFQAKLKSGGIVLVSTVTVPKGLCNTFGRLAGPLLDMGYDKAVKKIVVPMRLTKRLGIWLYAPSFYWSIVVAGHLLDCLRPGRVGLMYVLRKA
ncbi:MAG TPA: class I SAM-dependent methyltransferase [Rhodospirillales bacterium]|jgi:SAM-dependent methyltransferase|nr:class I SAM-dependent methyltransferase [Rhodospirillales bacterium]